MNTFTSLHLKVNDKPRIKIEHEYAVIEIDRRTNVFFEDTAHLKAFLMECLDQLMND